MLSQKFRLKDGSKGYAVAGVITFQGCNDGSCIPPTREPFEVVSEGFTGETAAEVEPAQSNDVPVASSEASSSAVDWWKPVVFPETEKPPVRI